MFNHVDNIGQRDVVSNLEDNLKQFLDWSFLNIGGFINITIPSTGLDGTLYHQLKPVNDPALPRAKVWQSPVKEWVYESGIPYTGQNPISISGLYLNNTFLPAPTGSGSYGYSVNYPLGHVVFDNYVSPTSKVEISYSYRYIQVYKANESVWWKELQEATYNTANYRVNKDYSTITANHMIQMPRIMIETIARNYQTPRELGTTRNILTQDVLLHIFTENPTQRSSIVDILLLQKDKALNLFNINKVIKDNVYPLNYKGQINPSGQYYNQISSNVNYLQSNCYIKDSILSEMNNFSASLYNGIVRWTVEIFR